jgi:hypothetical protein
MSRFKPRYERRLLPFTRNLEHLGIKARVRTVTTAQHENRTALLFRADHVAYWNRLPRLKVTPVYGISVDLW